MFPTHINLRNDQYDSLKKLSGSLSEHVRRAVDDYLTKVNSGKITNSISKGSDNNGRK